MYPQSRLFAGRRGSISIFSRGSSISRFANVLKSPADGIHGLHQHSFFVPVRPDELKQQRLVDPVHEQMAARRNTQFVLRERGFNDTANVGKLRRASKILALFLGELSWVVA